MATKINSFIERVLQLENYSAPLRTVTIDRTALNENFKNNLANIFLLPNRQIMEHQHWKSIGRTIIMAISDDGFIRWLSESNNNNKNDQSSLDTRHERIEANRQELIRKLSNYLNDKSLFAHDAVRNIVYLASEGSLIYDPYEDNGKTVAITPLIRQFIFNKVITAGKIKQDEYSFWLKTTNLLLQPVSQEFKEEFKDLFNYQIPFGLSPETDSKTLENLLSHANKIALFPLIQGSSEVGNAIAAHQWGIAIEAAATTGGSIIIIMSAIAFLDKLSSWSRRKKDNHDNVE